MEKVIPYNIQTHLIDLHNLSSRSGNESDAGLKFYQSGARNIFFKLEGISRILRYSVDKKTFNKYNENFKIVEDVLGVYDYYEAMYNGIADKEGIDENFLGYFRKNKEVNLAEMNTFLLDQKWIGSKITTYTDLIDDFSKIKYPKEKELRKNLGKYIIKQLKKVQDGYENGEFDLYDIEGGIHEIRRKLRWISIYAQVCNGWIQLKDIKSIPPALKKYHTLEIINSPFNKLPKPPQNFNSMVIDSTSFYALSWVISELGKLKDQGMKVQAINLGIKVCGIKDKSKIKLIKEAYNAPNSSLVDVPKQTKIILDNFFITDGIAENIISNINDCI